MVSKTATSIAVSNFEDEFTDEAPVDSDAGDSTALAAASAAQVASAFDGFTFTGDQSVLQRAGSGSGGGEGGEPAMVSSHVRVTETPLLSAIVSLRALMTKNAMPFK